MNDKFLSAISTLYGNGVKIHRLMSTIDLFFIYHWMMRHLEAKKNTHSDIISNNFKLES